MCTFQNILLVLSPFGASSLNQGDQTYLINFRQTMNTNNFTNLHNSCCFCKRKIPKHQNPWKNQPLFVIVLYSNRYQIQIVRNDIKFHPHVSLFVQLFTSNLVWFYYNSDSVFLVLLLLMLLFQAHSQTQTPVCFHFVLNRFCVACRISLLLPSKSRININIHPGCYFI